MRVSCLFMGAITTALAACGGSSSEEVSCARTDQEPLGPLQQAEVGAACAATPGDQLAIQFLPDPEAESEGCQAAAVFVAPNGYATPRISFGVMADDGRYTSTSAAVRDFLFTDRLSNSSAMSISSDTACSEVSLTVQELRCRVSMESDEDYQDCGPVTFEGTGMFAAFTPPED